jgi:diguanylate cyclase (GGDEF)-like protein/PAS domain S-box-containing protein
MDEHRSSADAIASPLERLSVSPVAILERLPDAVVVSAPDGRIVFVNELMEHLFGYGRQELIGQRVEILWPERLRAHYLRNLELHFSAEHALRFTAETFGRRRDGTEFAGEMSWGVIDTSDGPLLLAIGRDISERRAAEARFRAVARLGERALVEIDPARLAVEAVELLQDTLPLAGVSIVLAGEPISHAALPAGGERLTLPLGTGDELVVAPMRGLGDEETTHLRAVAHTLSVALARLRETDRIRHASVHDPLTGLANRTLLQEHLARALARSERDGTQTAVLFVDLDRFKLINDRHGHDAGDAVLAAVGARMRAAVRPTDTVARLGGDEFVIVGESIDEPTALALGRRLLDVISTPLRFGEQEFLLSASIGIALGYGDADGLLRDADSAGYRAKAEGRSRAELFR